MIRLWRGQEPASCFNESVGKGTALVLSAGGTFGAYQAGAWQALEERFRPDIVIGASIGSLNAWAIAGGCSGQDLVDRWLRLGPTYHNRFRMPPSLLGGFADVEPLYGQIREWHGAYKPRQEVGVVLTDLVRLKPTLATGTSITWQHLAASCAVFGMYPQLRIGGRLYSDGGMLDALPLWAAGELGADRIIAIHLLPFGLPSRSARLLIHALRRMGRRHVHAPDTPVVLIQPSQPLGGWKELLSGDAAAIGRWIEQGRRDAASANISFRECSDRI